MQKHDELLIALRKVIRAIGLHSKQLEKHVDLTVPQLLIMAGIADDSGPMVKELASATNLSPATVTSILDRLQSRGLILRQRDAKDKRKVGVFLTEKGKSVYAKAPQPLQASFVKRFAELEDWEQNQLVFAVQRLASMMDAKDIDASPLLEVSQIIQGD
ncbi:MarR family winged helix-turn-helix transcriptional regulator [Lacimicrobium alkaliphilum]|uniref:Transcriptional regulator n=1 Tax=Lacimicrobium alkaliphilum TaxID=1526571 RepID=A0A0U2JJZ3_9ALTE|nr:MarR family transcriptional regulator [Lacimicrobium alkaliphilum]ALT00327.1 transcriptional regulator [Lacimicrobium alkaliphilum]